jgi:hypothetical protein
VGLVWGTLSGPTLRTFVGYTALVAVAAFGGAVLVGGTALWLVDRPVVRTAN